MSNAGRRSERTKEHSLLLGFVSLKALRLGHLEVEALPLEANEMSVHLIDALEDALLEFVERSYPDVAQERSSRGSTALTVDSFHAGPTIWTISPIGTSRLARSDARGVAGAGSADQVRAPHQSLAVASLPEHQLKELLASPSVRPLP
jgi:hypothetical protein